MIYNYQPKETPDMSDALLKAYSEIDPKNLTHPTLAFLRSYWDEKRGARLMPSRKEIRPSDLRSHLGYVLMIEAIDDCADFRYRLIGTLVTQYFLTDATGKTVSESFAHHGTAAVKGVTALLRKTARDCIPMRSYGDANWLQQGLESFEAIYLPLSDDGKTCNMILHAFVFDRSPVMMAREIARANGGELPVIS